MKRKWLEGELLFTLSKSKEKTVGGIHVDITRVWGGGLGWFSNFSEFEENMLVEGEFPNFSDLDENVFAAGRVSG